MKKLVLSLGVLATVGFVSCKKEAAVNPATSSFSMEARGEQAVVNTRTTNYSKVEVEPLQRNGVGTAYTQGIIEYFEDGESIALVNFSKGDSENAVITDADGEKPLELYKGKKKGDSEYDKIIIEPIVKSEDCDFIVAGVIEYHLKGKWVATVDYGDGTCDEFASKTTDEGVFTFSMLDYK